MALTSPAASANIENTRTTYDRAGSPKEMVLNPKVNCTPGSSCRVAGLVSEAIRGLSVLVIRATTRGPTHTFPSSTPPARVASHLA